MTANWKFAGTGEKACHGSFQVIKYCGGARFMQWSIIAFWSMSSIHRNQRKGKTKYGSFEVTKYCRSARFMQ